MKLLLDTHVLIWIATVDQLTPAATTAFYDPENELYFSIASYWEMAIKIRLRKLTLDPKWIEQVDDTINQNGIQWLSIEQIHCQQVATMTYHHRDPFDRMLIAQALVEGMTLMTADANIQHYSVPTLW